MKKRIFVMIFIFIIFFIGLSTIFALINSTKENIIKGVSVNGIEVSNLGKQEASEKIKKVMEGNLTKTISLAEDENTKEDELQKVVATQIDGKYDYNEMVEKAYLIGRSKNIFVNNFEIIKAYLKNNNIEVNLKYNNNLLSNVLNDISSKISNKMEESSYYIEDLNLIIEKGKDGVVVDQQKLQESLIREINNYNGTGKIIIPKYEEKAQPIDVEKIYSEIHKEPMDAYIIEEPFEVHSHIDGVDFAISMEEAKNIISTDSSEYKIPLKITLASKKIQDLGEKAFPHELSKFTTKYDITNQNRSNNLKLASDKINEQVVMPGEIFSFNKVVGKRTIALGYKEASVYVNGGVEDGIGGGICQVSSTLYNAILLSNLEIVSRSNHYFMPTYVQEGLDATVSWGTIDFQFRNTRTYPIRIISSVKNGLVIIKIEGIREKNEFEVELESKVLNEIPYAVEYVHDENIAKGTEEVKRQGRNGFTSETFKILKKGNIIISRELISRDLYNATNKIVAVN